MVQDNINTENNNMDKPKARGRPKKTPDNTQPENIKAIKTKTNKKEPKQDTPEIKEAVKTKTDKKEPKQDKPEIKKVKEDKPQHIKKEEDIKKVKEDKPNKPIKEPSEQQNILKVQKALNKVKEAEQKYLEAIKQLQPPKRKQTKTQKEPKKNALTRTDDFLLRHDPLL